MAEKRRVICPEWGEETAEVTRRAFIQIAAAAALAASAGTLPVFAVPRAAAPSASTVRSVWQAAPY